jgi:peroxiredoxin
MSGRVEINTHAPDFSLRRFSGEPLQLSDYADKKHVYLVFNRGFL